MKVILLSDLRHCGRRGEVVEVKTGFGRNYLLPQGLAVLATPGNKQWFEEQRRKLDLRHAREKESALEAAAQFAGLQIKIPKRVGETETLYGSVTATEIGYALEEKGIQVDRRRLDLEGGIKTLGDHQVRVELHPEVIAEFTVTVVAEEE